VWHATRDGGLTADRADLVVVGAGTVGGWASVFAAEAAVGRVVVLERGLAGDGASSRAAGIVRAQGGTPATVAFGRWSIEFYRGQAARYGTDSGFREHGYVILAVTDEDERTGRERVAMQRAAGLDVRWVDAVEAAAIAGTLTPTGHRGGSYLATDGAISPPRNVRAYSLAMAAAGVELRERTALTGVVTRDGHVVGVETTAGSIATDRVILTGGPSLRAVGRLAGLRVPAGAVRHTVAVTEPHATFDLERAPMVFDIGRGLYWRLEEGGLLFGWSDPDDSPGEARSIDWAALDRTKARLATLVPVTADLGLRKVWAATIDYTPDHLPILGPGITPDGERIVGLTIASAGGHGMMWGPAVARVAADLAVHGRTDLTEIGDLGLDRFDEHGRSRLAPDPIALPFPVDAVEDAEGAPLRSR
jgi:sarcosine oxidase, subunit beta